MHAGAPLVLQSGMFMLGLGLLPCFCACAQVAVDSTWDLLGLGWVVPRVCDKFFADAGKLGRPGSRELCRSEVMCMHVARLIRAGALPVSASPSYLQRLQTKNYSGEE